MAVSNRFTALQLVEVWRGGKSAKVINSSWDKDPLHGSSSLSSEEAIRVIRRLVSLSILREELVVARERKVINCLHQVWRKGSSSDDWQREGRSLCGHVSERQNGGGMGLGDVESVPENERKLRELEAACLAGCRLCWRLVRIIILRTRSTMSTNSSRLRR